MNYYYPNYFYYYPQSGYYQPNVRNSMLPLADYGPRPIVFDMEEVTLQNNNFRLAFWTGSKMQMTLMSLLPGESIGLELHPSTDQFIRVEQGSGLVQMGDSRNNLTLSKEVKEDYAFFVPANKWHNLTNTGSVPLKLYSIYAPVQHPFGTVQATKQDATH